MDSSAAASHEQRTPVEIARRSRSSFLVSFGFTDPERRRGLVAVYAFCRVVDDAVDSPADVETRRSELALWEQELERACRGEAATEVGRALQQTMRRFGVERRHLRSVIDGVATDLDGPDFASMAELEAYCFKVASSVGLACLPVFGVGGADAERYALHLGQALQVTNILRDLRSDAEEGRVYMPRELLEELGVEPTWLRGGAADEVYSLHGPMAALTGVLSARAYAHFERAAACLDAEMQKKLLPAEVMGAVYRRLLVKLERLGGEVCRSPRVRVPGWRKMWIALSVRRRIRRLK